MSIQTIVFLFSSFIIVLVAINGVLFWHYNKTHKKLDELLEKGKIKEFKDIFLSQKEKNSILEKQIKDAFLEIEKLHSISQKTIQKTSIIRFNPFNEMGGNQSFVIAMLDAKNNGFVVSSLFVKEGNRVYTKSIKQGKPEYMLSAEEKEALEKAINKE